MPQLINSAGRADDIRLAANYILATRGIGGLSLRAIASTVRISLGSLTSHFESRTRLIHLMVQLSSRAWLDSISYRTRSEGVLGFLPSDEQGAEETRVWLSWCEIGRSDPAIRGTIHDIRLDERALVRRVTSTLLEDLGHGREELADDDLDIAVAVIHGLRQAICASEAPMTPEDARRLLGDHVQRVVEGHAHRLVERSTNS